MQNRYGDFQDSHQTLLLEWSYRLSSRSGTKLYNKSGRWGINRIPFGWLEHTIGQSKVKISMGNLIIIQTTLIMTHSTEYGFVRTYSGGVKDNLQIWLKADDNGGVTTNGASVTTWDNLAGANFTDASGALTYQNNASYWLNFNPVINFNGINTF